MENTFKTCYKCGVSKPLFDFNKSKSRKDGVQSICRPCSKEVNNLGYIQNPNRAKSIKETRAKTREHNRRLTNKYKVLCGCKFCSERTAICLDFHHLDPSIKEDNLSKMSCVSINKLKEEIRKCIVVCSNCHRKLHANLI